MQSYENEIARLRTAIEDAEAVVVGAGAGLSTAAGFTYAGERYRSFLEAHQTGKVLYLELGVGGNTPAIIKYPFWRYANANPKATYACINYGEAWAPPEIRDRSVLLDADVDGVLDDLLGERG